MKESEAKIYLLVCFFFPPTLYILTEKSRLSEQKEK